jgi:putative ABC transport system substrate-binding protein
VHPFRIAGSSSYDVVVSFWGEDVRRRNFLGILGGAASVLPLVSFAGCKASAQSRPHVRRIGVLMGYAAGDEEAQVRAAAIRDALQKRGWSEPDNCEIRVILSGDDPRAMRAAAEELVAWKAEAIISSPGQVTLVVAGTTSAIPVVFVNVPDPVGLGLVTNLARPSAHVTGFTSFETGLAGKWLELLRELAPGVRSVAVAYTPDNPAWRARLALMREVAPKLELRIVEAPLSVAADIDPTFGRLAAEPAMGLVVLPSLFAASHRETIVGSANRHRLPAMYAFRYFVGVGGLVSYGVDVLEQFRGAAAYVDRILRGEKPGDLPVQAPTNFELIINLRTAKALGVMVPPTLLARAHEVIE